MQLAKQHVQNMHRSNGDSSRRHTHECISDQTPCLRVGPKMRSNNNQTDKRMHIVFATALDHDSKRMVELAPSVAECWPW